MVQLYTVTARGVEAGIRQIVTIDEKEQWSFPQEGDAIALTDLAAEHLLSIDAVTKAQPGAKLAPPRIRDASGKFVPAVADEPPAAPAKGKKGGKA